METTMTETATTTEPRAIIECADVQHMGESVRQAYENLPAAPRPEWIRGECPQCGSPVVSNCYYVGGKGFLIVWECWQSLSTPATCQYRKAH